jgi:BirA family biotin operon repressor/biotin-[acetyl-CoA-carboxylase] ligase
VTGPPIHWLDRVTSTQDAAHQLAGEGAPDGTAIAAREQTHGRGSRGRGWLSPPGGLWLSVVCRPAAAGAPHLLTIRVSLAVAAVLTERAGTAIGIKWPNDLMIANRKLGGVLAEARWVGDALAWIVVGVGINVTNTVPSELRSAAVSLAEVGRAGTPADLAGPVVASVLRAARRSGPLDAGESADLAVRDWLRGRTLSAPVAGIADGIGSDGGLLVRTAGAVHLVRSGPVVLASSTLHA